ncbi:LuxR C-terminal-related transcriptional regulator [Thermoanaerobacterium sp. RBIITD]|uniref:LuxR C-terminal-related transcriptional regulator n=1 Tax=Thermoanaerobacterium sp. RBIITD TaxID=1550240 RepID=UPI000BB7A279|nr:LuxR C-terminal-related transcriptional regulator [Thermoanaerobacterium sp. RBIITD]SNX54259.1 regulatory protein, luxR family [Thermoanaerobacterium sp. RBIITD]
MKSILSVEKGCEELINSYGESLLINVSPNIKFFDKVLSNEELAIRKDKNKHIISIIENLIRKNHIYDNLVKKGYFFIICDTDGYVVKLIYDEQLKNYFDALHFTEGISMRLKDCGTNAINLAIKTNKQVEINGKDHYCRLFSNWYCTAAPIIDYYSEKIIAYIDMTVVNKSYNKLRNIILSNISNYIEEIIMYRHEIYTTINSRLSLSDKLILTYLANGLNRKEIIKEMNISEATLRRYIEKLKIKLKAQNDIVLILNAINAGILDTCGNIL